MTTFVLIPGAGGVAWYWSRVVPLIEAAGHHAIAVDLPGNDETATFATYTGLVVAAIGAPTDVVVVAQSLGGFTAPMVCERITVRALVFVNAMIPQPGETSGDWWDHTGQAAARITAACKRGYSEQFDLATYFLHDVPPEIAAEGEPKQRPQSEAIFAHACELAAWPAVPIHVIAGKDDRFFPLEFQRRVAHERLHVDVDVLPGGHLIALSNPRGLVDQLLSYVR